MKVATGSACRMAVVKILVLGMLLCIPFLGFSQNKKVKVYAKSTRSFKKDGVELMLLKEDVRFIHEGAVMTCDSAYYDRKKLTLDAYANIHVNQGDTVQLFGDRMFYDGQKKHLNIEGNVKFIDRDMTLESNRIDYDRNTGFATYFGGGTITNEGNTLFSKIGAYNSNSKWLTFKDSVTLESGKYKIESDTLLYQPSSGLARFRGPTLIQSDSGYIKCTYGDYDTKNEVSYFSERAEIHDRTRILIGDSIYFNRGAGEGRLYGDVYLADTADHYVIRGQFAEYVENPENAFVTGMPLYTMLSGEDSVHIHGDTLRITSDTEGKRKIKVFPHAKIYKSDIQGKCDSLVYNEQDSLMHMYVNPVLWNGRSQLTANDIILKLRNEQLDSIFMIKKAFILTQVDSLKYDQVRGKNMYGKFINNELNSLKVIGNGQTVYTVVDQGVQQGVNRADCSDLIVRFKESAISQVVFMTKPNAKMYPLHKIPKGELFLRGFNNRLDEQPKSKQDLFKR